MGKCFLKSLWQRSVQFFLETIAWTVKFSLTKQAPCSLEADVLIFYILIDLIFRGMETDLPV